jgi:hypothetical protein
LTFRQWCGERQVTIQHNRGGAVVEHATRGWKDWNAAWEWRDSFRWSLRPRPDYPSNVDVVGAWRDEEIILGGTTVSAPEVLALLTGDDDPFEEPEVFSKLDWVLA